MYRPICHGALKLDLSTLLATFFLSRSFQFILPCHSKAQGGRGPSLSYRESSSRTSYWTPPSHYLAARGCCPSWRARTRMERRSPQGPCRCLPGPAIWWSNKDTSYDISKQNRLVQGFLHAHSTNNLRKGKVLRKHSLHSENSSLGFIEAVHHWMWNMPLHWGPLAHEWNSIFKCKNINLWSQRARKTKQHNDVKWSSLRRKLFCWCIEYIVYVI